MKNSFFLIFQEKVLTFKALYYILYFAGIPSEYLDGGIPEWPKGTDCKSVGSAFEGSNPSPSIIYCRGVEQLVARRAHNPKAAGSSPVPAIFYC